MILTEHEFALIEKYNRPGPRYTSYPPANHFVEIDDPSPLLAGVRAGEAPLSLYFHLPFCETLCWFCGCHTITTTDHRVADQYLDDLERELALFSRHLPPGHQAVQLHFGGGTPNFFGAPEIDRLARMIEGTFHFPVDAEKSVELDPRRLSVDHVAAFARMGVTRASFGVQDCDAAVQQAIHRIQPQEMNVSAMQLLRDHGFRSVNVDLIYGLPGQSVETFARTLDQVLELQPDRFAIFNYAHVPWMKPAQKLLARAGLPSPRQKLELLGLCIQTLTSAGYVYIGMDHFAKPEDELVRAQRHGTLQRNFQGYSTRAGVEICGFGISSISQGPHGFRQNMKSLEEYRAALDASRLPVARGYFLTDEDRLRGAVIMRLMCDLSLDFDAVSHHWNIDFRNHFASALTRLEEFAADGLIEWTASGFRVSELGRLFVRNLAMCFDAYLAEAEDPAGTTPTALSQRYSRTI